MESKAHRIFDSELLNILKKFETKRKNILLLILAGTIFAIILIVYSNITNKPAAIYFIIVFFYITFYKFIYSTIWKEYIVVKYKNLIFNNISPKINKSFKYEAEKFIPQEDFENSYIFFDTVNLYKASDYIYGKIENTDFELCKVNAHKFPAGQQYPVILDSELGNIKVFHGLFFKASFKKKFISNFIILPNNCQSIKHICLGKLPTKVYSYEITPLAHPLYEKILMFFGKKTLDEDASNRANRVNAKFKISYFTNKSFENNFSVYGEDDNEIRKILTPEIIYKILALKNLLKNEIYFSFVDSNINFMISSHKDYFEPPLIASSIHIDAWRQVTDEISFFKDLIEDLNNNSEIWI